VAEIVDAAQRFDAGFELGGFPMTRAEVMQVEVAAVLGRKQQLVRRAYRQLCERSERVPRSSCTSIGLS
jgi:hypothetical protein